MTRTPGRGSIQVRLALAGGIVLALTLLATFAGLSTLFTRHAERTVATELSAAADFLVAMVEPGADGAPDLIGALADPRYERPYSGHYWRVEIGPAEWTSRSLWDFTLPIPALAPLPEAPQLVTLRGPRDTVLLALDRVVVTDGPGGPEWVRIIVARDRAEIDVATQAFRADMRPYLAALGALILLAGWVQIRVGLEPLRRLGQRLRDLAAGRSDHIGDDLPVEVAPLARQIDDLIASRAAELVRSRRRAADLAHGLKTPLQALLGEAAHLRQTGSDRAAEGIETVVQSIGRLVDRELARATLAQDGHTGATDPAPLLRAVAGVVQRTPAGQRLSWEFDLTDGLTARIDSADLTEALGALIENASAHARSKVRLAVMAEGAMILVTIADDGPGLPADQRARLRQRGQRLDNAGDGTGLGLAIADEIISLAGGRLDLADADPGLLVTVHLSAARGDGPGHARPGA